MQHVANSTATLAFPCTITAMALQGGVLIDDDDEIAYPDDQLDNTTIDYVLRRAPWPPAILEDAEPHPEAKVPFLPPPKPELAPTADPVDPSQQNV